MKVINKILCFLSALVMCVPLLCFNVGAEYSESVGNFLRSFDLSKYKSISLLEHYKYDSLTNGESVLIDLYDYNSFSSDCYIVPFSDVLERPYLVDMFSKKLFSYDNLYYVNFVKGNTPETFSSLLLCSETPIYLKDFGDYISFYSDSYENDGYFHCFYVNSSFFSYYSSGHSKKPCYYCSSTKFEKNTTYLHNGDFVRHLPIKYTSDTTSLLEMPYFDSLYVSDLSLRNYTSVTWDSVYSNCNILDKSVLPNLNDKKISSFSSDGTVSGSLKDQVSVKLTPEFGLDMDRVFDKNTGQNDYFKFDITNNSDKNIQWCSYIVDSDYEDDENGINDSEDIRYLVPSYEYCKWLYITDEIYYSSSVKTEKKYLGLKTETTLTANKKTGAFYFHLLKPGETYSDYIYWENVNIQPLKSYDIRFNCLPVDDLSFPSDMFSSRYFVDTLGSILGSDFEKEEGFDDYVIDDTLYTEVYRCSFSVLDMPDFTLTVKGGNSIGNGGFSDAETLKNNFETSTDLSDGRIHANSNYIENPLLLNGSDVNVDLNNVTIDNVKSYISQCSDFFSLIKSVLIAFPTWIWVLICFGLTALIVIAIVRYIRG